MPNKPNRQYHQWQHHYLLRLDAVCWQRHVQLPIALDRDLQMEAWAASLMLLENSRQYLRHAMLNRTLSNEQTDLLHRLVDTAHLAVRECLQPLRSDDRLPSQPTSWIESALFAEIRQVLQELPEALKNLRPAQAEPLFQLAMLLAELANEPQRVTLQLAAAQLPGQSKLPEQLLPNDEPLITPRQMGSLIEELESIRSACRSMAA